jgi:hypothetical protein
MDFLIGILLLIVLIKVVFSIGFGILKDIFILIGILLVVVLMPLGIVAISLAAPLIIGMIIIVGLLKILF